jgi:hypothetical protein
MKKLSFVFAFALILLFSVLYSCKKSTIKIENFCTERFIVNDTINFKVNICLELPVKGDSSLIKTINQTLIKQILDVDYNNLRPQKSIEEHIEAALNNYQTVVKELPDEVFSNIHEEKIKGFVSYLDNNYLCYTSENYNYAGGAHGLETTLYFVFDLNTGKQLMQNDVFTDEKPILTEIAKILRDTLLYPDNDTYNLDNLLLNGNFTFVSDTLIYTYNPYEIAPYSSGIINVKIPYQSIETITKIDLSRQKK